MTDVFDEIKSMMRANFPLIYLTTTEYGRATQKLRTLCFKQDIKFNVWDAVDGLMVHGKDANNRLVEPELHEAWEGTKDSYSLLEWIHRELIEGRKDNTPEVFMLEDCHPSFSEKKYPELLRKLAAELKYFNKHIVFVGPYTKLPIEIEKYITIVNIDLPDRDDLRIRLRYVAGKDYEINPDLEKFIIDSALGLTDTEADLAFRLAKEKVGLNRSECVQIIANEKEQIIKKSGILDYIPVNMSLNDTVGGLENLKKWLTLRSKAFELKAKEFGLPEPKGILLLGVPGCGKSLTAKCIASEWKQPLLKLDIGKVFQAEVGSSENNIRQALSTAEAIAPCVLWIDEIEKGLSTAGGERDGGTNSRVFSTILTWMQERKTPVFVVATANKIESLAPELLRKGRFDEIFFIDLPTPEERYNIFRIHLAKFHQNGIKNLDELVNNTRGFNGAEIEETVKEAMFIAYVENPNCRQIEERHLLESAKQVVPLAQTMCNEIKQLRAKAKDRKARLASLKPNEEAIESEEPTPALILGRNSDIDSDNDIFNQNN